MLKLWVFFKRILPLLLIAGGILISIYFLFVRPWILQMGLNDEEVGMVMEGDELVESPTMEYTQAVTINAPIEIVWGYLVQVGYKRAGWYNWDFINRLAAKNYFYENNRSANRIIPELQNLQEGDKIFLLPQIGLDVTSLKENEIMLLTGSNDNQYEVSWLYKLREIDDQDKTRLYVRWRSNMGGGLLVKIMNLLITEPGGIGIQQSLMLKGIKKRAERDH